MSSPVAVLISDVHYNINTLKLANEAMKQAIDKANDLGVPLVVCGDLHDTKANIRGECISAMIDVFKTCKRLPYVLVGNHCRINEKSPEHSLEFLRPWATIIDNPKYVAELGSWLIPYFSDSEELKVILDYIEKPARLIMHTGILGADMGHYIKDTSSLPKEIFADFRVISGHYHRRQDIKCGRPRKGAVGLFSYVGNPYTLGFGEADHPEKGFQVLHDDGSLEFVPTLLRKHVVLEYNFRDFELPVEQYFTDSRDLLWIKVSGTRAELATLKKEWAVIKFCREDFKLDLIPTDSPKLDNHTSKLDNSELMDMIIDSTGESEEYRTELKGLWREVLEDT